jgi:hypothetical protein
MSPEKGNWCVVVSYGTWKNSIYATVPDFQSAELLARRAEELGYRSVELMTEEHMLLMSKKRQHEVRLRFIQQREAYFAELAQLEGRTDFRDTRSA